MGRKQQTVVAPIILFSAVAALLVINPFEQIHQIQDRRVEADTQRFLEAVEDYYKVFFEYPWEALGHLDPDEAVIQNFWLQELVDKGVIDSKFAGRSSWCKVYITQSGTTVYACFDPTSERFQTQADEQGKGRDGAFGCLSDCWVCQNSE